MPDRTHRPTLLGAGILLAVLATTATGYKLHAADTAPSRAAAPASVPVETTAAVRRSVPVYLSDIGTVEPFNTVTIRTRVDGELQQVLFKEGQDIEKGALLAVIDPRTYQAALDAANAKLAQDQANLDNAQLILQREATLGKDSFASQQAVDNERSTVEQLKAQIEQDKADIASAQTELSYTQIAAPISGRAGLRLVDQGNIVHAGDATGLVVLNQIHPIAVISTLPQASVEALRRALAADSVEAQAVSRDDGSKLDVGTVAIIDNQIDPQSGTLKVKSVFPNQQDRLWPGQFVDTRIKIATLPDVVTIPADAVQRGPDGPFVFIMDGTDKVAVRPVKLGQIADGIAVIDSGLDTGEVVVVRGQYRLDAGVRVAPSPWRAGTSTAAPAGN